MNPSTDGQPLPPPLPPLPHRPSATCPRHPQEHFTAFCPLCLCERLSLLDSSSAAAASSSSSSSRKPHSTAASALKAIFRPPPPNRPSSFFPELRRTKSFSASKNEAFSTVFEPQRKSCDVRLRNTLCSLISQDASSSSKVLAPAAPEIVVETKNLEDPCSSWVEPIPDGDGDIRVSGQPNVGDFVIENSVQEIVEEEIQVELESESVHLQEEFKTMKDHIDLDSHTKKPSGRGSFWSAASVFSKKLQKWRDKQKEKKQRNGGGSTTLPVEKPIGRHFRETQSEIADYGFGRRSCDIDPRFSLDAGRMSFDDPRYSFDEPRASWDGYLISRTFPRMPTMLSVVEDAPIHVFRSDTQIPVEDSINSTNEEENIPGGSSQTREYYSDSSSRRRKSLDRSNSIRKTAAAVVAEIDDMKSSVSNAKVSPATTDVCHVPKLGLPDRDSNSNSLRDDYSGSFEDAASVVGTANRKEESKKSKGWGKGWKIWGLINRRGGNKDEEEDRESSRPNGVERSYSESWPELRGDRNGDVKAGGFNPKMFRSNSSVSWRSASMMGGSFSSSRKSNAESNGNGKRKKEEPQPVLERNRSARHSPTNVDNGLLRFYLTPLRGSRRGGSGKVKPSQAQSIARSVLRLY
ncbi:hypothetical protein IC582_009591 [Cucumis melo]|uniref:Protein OCTOPUS n=1 Tax=Cucumis melo TaxID=3656 RepID=A0A1S3B6I0_CUCME|nr:protein OCTOPUS [Cucumis melo]